MDDATTGSGRSRATWAVLAGLMVALGACGESHEGDEDAGRGDAGPDAEICPPIAPPTCVDEACCVTEAPAEAVPGCRFVCPEGYVEEPICEPGPGCGDFAGPCERHDECALAITDCCGPCGSPTLDAYDAILTSRADAHRDAVCPDPGGTVCPACAVMPNPELGATCDDASRCAGFDVGAMELSACEVDADCRLRVTQCCECGGDTDPFALIAIRTDAEGDYAGLVCDDLACPECEPAYPDTVRAACGADGHCEVVPADGG
ncbi:MAG TPA: hypothetical protein RMH85_20290 [Polyangiaceae bacterium LLY-WYZ-15_(1-7)]|nr:hypothetical protein [Myxococcales bacterium]MAT23766.1 hypothetical protein [Sandaracinus sp.]HJK90234.1 hypothetical protein [Polyangiaceae bacterium LLY-WYZ-15_(1-7)]MBJ72951.1 hypothetical protein [Sandaracinus sp.]HJL06281.1 hypothetical protein [Polyangiaceae bacterium LLY-WYZ-15_(1-7)]